MSGEHLPGKTMSYTWNIKNAHLFATSRKQDFVSHMFTLHGEWWRVVFFPFKKNGGATFMIQCLTNNMYAALSVKFGENIYFTPEKELFEQRECHGFSNLELGPPWKFEITLTP